MSDKSSRAEGSGSSAALVGALKAKIDRNLGAISRLGTEHPEHELAVEGASEMLKHARTRLDNLVSVENLNDAPPQQGLVELSKFVARAERLLGKAGLQ